MTFIKIKFNSFFTHKDPQIKKLKKNIYVDHHRQFKISSLLHISSLVIRPDNTFEIFIDDRSVRRGNLLKDFDLPVNPESEINDSNDHKSDDNT